MRIGLVDDDDAALDFLCQTLGERGHQCLAYRHPRDFIAALQRESFDLLVLDWSMPKHDGMDLMARVRRQLGDIPILMFSSRSDKDDIASALEAGIDDFIVKPESGRVVAAKVEAMLRRVGARAADERFERHGPYVFDRVAETVKLDDADIPITPREFALARLFFASSGRPLSRTYLLDTVWKSVADLPTRTLDMHVSRIRAKLRLRAENGYLLQTVFGYGYRLERIEHARSR